MSWGPTLRADIEAEFAALSGQVCIVELENIGMHICRSFIGRTGREDRSTGRPRGRPKKLNEREAAMTLLSAGMKVADVAARVGVHPRTIANWKKQ